MGFLGSIFGHRQRVRQQPTHSPEQIAFSNFMLQQAQRAAQNPYEGWEPIEQMARKGFQESIPTIAERWTALSPNAQRSSGFQSALGRAGAGLEQSLAALRSQYGLQKQGFAGQLGSIGMSPHFENLVSPASPGLLGNVLGSAAKSFIPFMGLF